MEKVMRLHEDIKKHYSKTYLKEWKRLTKKGTQQLEFSTTWHFLRKFLPKKGLILDAGSGPGRYTVEFTKMGYDVVALDPVEKNLEFLRKAVSRYGDLRHLKETVNGRLEHLSVFKENTFDAVVSLGGPMSHIMHSNLRRKAAREIIRITRPGGKIFASVMGRLSLIRGLLVEFPKDLDKNYAKGWVKTGDYTGGYGFTAFHGFNPDEFSDLFKSKNFKLITLAGLEGFGSYADKYIKKLGRKKRQWAEWLKMHIETVEEPSITGVSEHILLVGEKAR